MDRPNYLHTAIGDLRRLADRLPVVLALVDQIEPLLDEIDRDGEAVKQIAAVVRRSLTRAKTAMTEN